MRPPLLLERPEPAEVLAVVLGLGYLAAANFAGAERRTHAWWLPDTVMRLGLDLQGGIHWVLGVKLEAAIDHELDYLVGQIEEDLEARFWPEVKQHWGEVAVTGLHDAFVIRYEPGGATAGLGLHHDVAQISAHVKLNQGYEGGALSFPRQEWDTSEVSTGELVVWPSLVTHPHRSEPVSRGVKYGLTLWFRLPGD